MPDAQQDRHQHNGRLTGDRKRPDVVIAGGGVAGLEALLALRELVGRQVELTLLSRGRQSSTAR